MTGGHTSHPPIEGLLPPTGIEPASFRNLVSKVVKLQVHDTTPSSDNSPSYSEVTDNFHLLKVGK